MCSKGESYLPTLSTTPHQQNASEVAAVAEKATNFTRLRPMSTAMYHRRLQSFVYLLALLVIVSSLPLMHSACQYNHPLLSECPQMLYHKVCTSFFSLCHSFWIDGSYVFSSSGLDLIHFPSTTCMITHSASTIFSIRSQPGSFFP
jgi:hypothetical protein